MRIKKIILAITMALCCAVFSSGCSNKGASGNTGEITFADGDKIAEITIEHYGTIKAKLFPEIAPVGVENFIKLAEQGYYDGLKIHRVVADFMFQGGSLNGDGTGGTALYTGEETGVDFGVETSQDARHFYGALCYANAMGRNTTQFYIVNNKQPQDISAELDPKNIKAVADSYTAALEGLDADSYDYMNNQFLATYYTNLAEMVEKASDEVKEKYKNGGTPTLDGGYTVFGQVYEGFDVIDSISSCEVETNSIGEKSKPVQDIIISSVKITTYTVSTGEANNSSNASNSKPVAVPSSNPATEENSSAPETVDKGEDSGSTKESE